MPVSGLAIGQVAKLVRPMVQVEEYAATEVIRENIYLGRPEQVQLLFSRKLKRSTVADGRCRTRIITEGVIPSLHIY